MSSHHFVKEGQEPALFIVRVTSFEIIEPLLEWAPWVLVGADALDDVLLHGIKIDAVLTPSSRVASVREKVAGQWPVEIVEDTSDKNIARGVAYLLAKDQHDVNIIVSDAQEAFPIAQQHATQSITILDATHKWVFCGDGFFEKWLPKEAGLAIHSEDGGKPVLYAGKPVGNGFQIQDDGFVKLNSSTPFWVGEAL